MRPVFVAAVTRPHYNPGFQSSNLITIPESAAVSTRAKSSSKIRYYGERML